MIDCDVHQGNGTAAIFRDDPSVFTFSMHGANNYPFRKEVSDLDVVFADGTGDAEYLAALEDTCQGFWPRIGPTSCSISRARTPTKAIGGAG